MMYLEMSRDEAHGGGSWAFPLCLWAPTQTKRKTKGGGRWPFWSKILDVKAGDTILHLRGVPPAASFVGYSTASTDGFETSDRPSDPGEWSYSEKFFRADLQEFTPFDSPISLSTMFSLRRSTLEHYFDVNKARRKLKQNVFFVRQSGRLQCLNGAYLSDVDEELFAVIFGITPAASSAQQAPVTSSVATSQQLAMVQRRAGQSVFSGTLKELYGNTCCFPSCSVSDVRFLVGSHIARWSDNAALRGHLGNGLCLCLMHDKAFELGLFTLDNHFRVYINPTISSVTLFAAELKAAHGKKIRTSKIVPLSDALAEHWLRVKLTPEFG